MNTKHAPGPWIACDTQDSLGVMHGLYEIYNKPFGLGRIAWAVTKEDARRIAECVNACEGIADPSAVPELLKACQLAVKCWFNGEVSEIQMELVLRAAITKATGETI